MNYLTGKSCKKLFGKQVSYVHTYISTHTDTYIHHSERNGRIAEKKGSKREGKNSPELPGKK